MRTNGLNAGVTTEDVIARLREWERRYSFEIVGAGFDWVEAHFKKVPEDLAAFAQEVVAFSPGVLVGVGEETVEEYTEWMRRAKEFVLWWD